MCVDTRVAGSSCQILVFSVGDVCAVFRDVFFCQSEIDYVQFVTAFPAAHQEIVGFDVPVQEIARMHVLDSRNIRGNTLITSSPSEAARFLRRIYGCIN